MISGTNYTIFDANAVLGFFQFGSDDFLRLICGLRDLKKSQETQRIDSNEKVRQMQVFLNEIGFNFISQTEQEKDYLVLVQSKRTKTFMLTGNVVGAVAVMPCMERDMDILLNSTNPIKNTEAFVLHNFIDAKKKALQILSKQN